MFKQSDLTSVHVFYLVSAPHHFNSEMFFEGKVLITEGVGAIKANIRMENFQTARETLGRVLHTLQVRAAKEK